MSFGMGRAVRNGIEYFYKNGVLIAITGGVLLSLLLGSSFIWSKPDMPLTVSVTTETGLNKEITPERENYSSRLIFSPSTGQVRPSWQWRERVRAVVQQIAAANNYRIYKALYNKLEYPDPDAGAIFLFKNPESKQPPPHGLLVLTPEAYVELSKLDQAALESAIHQRLFGQWETHSGQDAEARAMFGRHVLDLTSILYSQPRLDQGFPVSMQPPLGEAPLIVECGDLHLSLDPTVVNQFLEQPALIRDRDIAEMVEKLDPKIIPYLRSSGK